MENNWIVVMGYSGSGKTTLANILVKKGIPTFEYSRYYKENIDLENVPREKIYEKVKEYIAVIGRKQFITDLIYWIEKQLPPKYDGPIFIVGARHSDDVSILKSLRSIKFCVLITCPDNLRFERIIKRNRNIDVNIIKDITKKGNMKKNPELIRCIEERTNYIIENNTGTNNLEEQVEILLKTVNSI